MRNKIYEKNLVAAVPHSYDKGYIDYIDHKNDSIKLARIKKDGKITQRIDKQAWETHSDTYLQSQHLANLTAEG
jgi:hypothetical protein